MTIQSDSSLFKQERELTDDSLITERGKTDQSLIGSQKKAERKSDEKVKNARLESDENKAQERAEADNNSKDQTSNRLQEKRTHEDDNVERERTLVDAAIRDERTQKEVLLNISLNKEREETDQNLSRERLHVDIEVERSSKLFSEEITSHSETKVALTSRDEFLAIVSHDLRNPIGSIVSASTHLLEDPSAINEADLMFWIKLIKRNAESSLRLISDLLDMERFAEGKLQVVPTKTNMDKMINDCLSSFGHVAEEKNIKLSKTESSVSMTVNCDRDRIYQVLSNLLGNALKFTPSNGSVTVDVQQTKTGLQISVSDTGPGIADDQKKLIFDRFAQINNKDRQGLGLGLYISKMLMEAHKGKLWVTSTVGKGSTFFFSLPA